MALELVENVWQKEKLSPFVLNKLHKKKPANVKFSRF
jgi:hypothetical protein